MILLIDNFDSFTFNLHQYIRILGHEVAVRRNDAITPDGIEALAPTHIVISPGAGGPAEAGISVDCIRRFKGRIPILGICLGHQAIGTAFGGEIVRSAELVHGKASDIHHDGRGIFSGLKNPFRAVRYHSLAVKRASLPPDLEVSAWTDDGEIMGLRHRLYSVDGVQFHPESIGTECGLDILSNFLDPRPRPSSVQTALRKVIERRDLETEEAEIAMEEIAAGKATPAQISALLTALAMKGESVSEIAGFARVMRRKATAVKKPEGRIVVDTCGTGGDAKGTFNISTCAAIVAAGAGATVAKHGNRSATSRCGSADLLEALGVNLQAPPEVLSLALDRIGFAFLFAPKFHPSMNHAAPVRREMGVRTVFNILGPLSNPAQADSQMIGVFDGSLLRKMAEVLVELGVRKALVVHGGDGLDEITLSGPSHVAEVRDGWIQEYDLHPEEFGFSLRAQDELAGGTLRDNCEIALSVLNGAKGAFRDATVLNAAAAIVLAGKAADLREAVSRAEDAIDSGAARKKLDDLILLTQGEGAVA